MANATAIPVKNRRSRLQPVATMRWLFSTVGENLRGSSKSTIRCILVRRTNRVVVSCQQLGLIGNADLQVAQKPVTDSVNPPVYSQLLAPAPGILDDSCLTDVNYLFNHIQLAEPVKSMFPILDR